MAHTCPNCHNEVPTSRGKSSTWVPLLTAFGVSAAAFLVYRQVRRASAGDGIDNILESCSRAARDLDRRLGEFPVPLAS